MPLSILNCLRLALPSTHRYIFVQTLEPTTLLLQQSMRPTVLNQRTLIHDDDFVEVENRVQSVGDGDDGVGSELLTEEALYD